MAAAGGSLKNIFENNPLQESVLSSWTQLLPKAETETSFDMFGEICHRLKTESSSSSPESNYPPPPPPPIPLPSPRLDKSASWNGTTSETDIHKTLEIFGEICYPLISKDGDAPLDLKVQSPTKFENLLDADADAGNNIEEDGAVSGGECEKKVIYTRSHSDVRYKCNKGLFPPPITSIGRCGKPRVYFKSYRQDGRFVLREIRIPTQRLLQATREDGRLRMQVISPVEDVAARRRGEKQEDEEEDKVAGGGGEEET